MDEYNESICRSCLHSYVCEQFNEHRDSYNQKCHFYNDHFVPAADVAPVRHARWEVVVGSDGKEHMVCTGCRKQQDLTGVFSYCPNCGCRMDGGDDE